MRKKQIQSVAATRKGNIRRINQDNFYLNGLNTICYCTSDIEYALNSKDTFQLYAVFDGLGGESYGEEAALIGVQVVHEYKTKFNENKVSDVSNYLETYFYEANDRICDMTNKRSVTTSGTTAAVVCFYKNKFYCGNIGDTKIYLYREGKLQQLSVDHTDVALYLKMGVVVDGEQKKKRSSQLTQHLGIDTDEMLIEPHIFQIEPKENDILLICSDGLNERLEDEMIREILASSKDIELAKKRLLEQAFHLKSKDNITIMLLQVHNIFSIF